MKSNSTTDIGRRAFLERTAWAVTAAALGGAAKAEPAPGKASLVGFVAPKLDKIRVGVIGIGGRGSGAVRRLCKVPGVEITAVCDLIEDRAKKGQDMAKKAGFREHARRVEDHPARHGSLSCRSRFQTTATVAPSNACALRGEGGFWYNSPRGK